MAAPWLRTAWPSGGRARPITLALILLALVAAVWLLRWGWALLRAGGALWIVVRGSDSLPARISTGIEELAEHYPLGEDRQIPYHIYRPAGRNAGPAIVVYHGATPYGEEHPALVSLARGLAHIGFTVFIPRLPRLKQVIIDQTSIDAMRRFYRYVQGLESVSPDQISVAGTSFAGALMLKALVGQDMQQPPPKAVLTYGSYCDMETALRYILTGEISAGGTKTIVEPDRWGQLIFFYSFLDQVPGSFDTGAVREVLDHYLRDSSSAGDAAKDQLPDDEKRIANLILTPGNSETAALAEVILSRARPQLEALSPAHFAGEINFPVWVIHGRKDRAVPYTEALALKRLLRQRVHLHITNLYEHTELGLGRNILTAASDLVRLGAFFARFIRAMER